MNGNPLTRRVLKHKVFELLRLNDIDRVLAGLDTLPPRRAVNPLFSYIQNSDPEIKWKAVTGMGAVTAKLADGNMESARVVIRRLMWNLNDESGGIGWGSPEAMGEILASNEALADEYFRILISYVRENGNFQAQKTMQRGIIWGIGRLSQVRPCLIRYASSHFPPYLGSPDATVRGITAWLIGLIGAVEVSSDLEPLTRDETEIQIYIDRQLVKHQVKHLAKEALEKLNSRVINTSN